MEKKNSMPPLESPPVPFAPYPLKKILK